MSAVALCLVILMSRANLVQSFLLTVDIDSEECFYETLTNHSKMAIVYDVVNGGFMDIRFRLDGPNESVMHDDKLAGSSGTSSTGRYMFSATLPGMYRFCFINKQTSSSLKDIKFTVEFTNASNAQMKNASVGNDLIGLYVKELRSRLYLAKYDSEISILRMSSHHNINESTNSFVTWWAFFELVFALALVFTQVIYLRKLFEQRIRL